MCGINGVVGAGRKGYDLVRLMNGHIVHRGPDDEGLFMRNNVAMGMRRLAIIDIADGKQPMANETENLFLVFNGEIYNFIDLRKRLIQKGHKFKSNSDTEVIIHLYEDYGYECLRYLEGMFAFAIYDTATDRIFIARDRIGKKPLYYAHLSNMFVWASELKSITRVFDTDKSIHNTALNIYFEIGFIPAPYTIFGSIHKLESAHYLVLDVPTLKMRSERYWSPVQDGCNIKTTFSDAAINVKGLLKSAVQRRMVADVPLGCFLSGGVDSSIIAYLMTQCSTERVKTFSIGCTNRSYDDSKRAISVAKLLDTDHINHFISPQDILPMIDELILDFDEPFADSSLLPTYLVSRLTRKEVTVALTGDGGDEVFGGYNRYLLPYYMNKYRMFIPSLLHQRIIKPLVNNINLHSDKRGFIKQFKKFIAAVGKDDFESVYNIMSMFYSLSDRKSLFRDGSSVDSTFKESVRRLFEAMAKNSLVERAMMIDLQCALEGDMLVKVDRMSMLNSLECRCPFLDTKVIEFSCGLPEKFKINGRKRKLILREAFKNELPESVFTLPKSGFGIPVGDWLRTSFKNELLAMADKTFLKSQDIFNGQYIEKLVNQHIHGKKDETFKVWAFYCFQKWYKHTYG